MENLSDLKAALLGLANDRPTRDFSRRDLLTGASVLGAMALGSAAPAAQTEITVQRNDASLVNHLVDDHDHARTLDDFVAGAVAARKDPRRHTARDAPLPGRVVLP